ncbi:MAG: DUF2490 domain-containing protein [bacterium]
MSRTALLCMVIAILAAAGAPGKAAGGWEYRGRVEMSGPVERDLSLKLMTEVRSRNDLATHNESHFDMGLEYNVRDWLSVGPYYRHVTASKNGEWTVEHRPHADATLAWRSLGLEFNNRNRLEYRMLEGAEFFRLRLRLMLSAAPGAVPGVKVYVSDEPFYDFRAGAFNKNRFIAGIDVKLLKTIKLGVNYVLDSTGSTGHWEDLNALALVLKYKP